MRDENEKIELIPYFKFFALQLVELADELLALVERYNTTHDEELELRVGISTGPLIAGVIGSQRYSYDIWGDTVNVASRMESTGEPGRIQVTQEVMEATSAHRCFEPRGTVEIKGRGTMQTFWSVGPMQRAHD